jgi:hypothetical protein
MPPCAENLLNFTNSSNDVPIEICDPYSPQCVLNVACNRFRRPRVRCFNGTSQLRSWVKEFAGDPQHAFPGQGQMKPEQAEIARLKREVTKLKAERDILKKAAAYFAKEST